MNMVKMINQDVLPDVHIVPKSVNIDSRDRDKGLYKNTNDYVVNLKEPLFGVKRVELVSAEIPKSEYFIDDTNNLLELLIDPVLFANRAPTGYAERLIALHHPGNTVTVMRVDSSQRNGHGVLDVLSGSDDQITKGVSAVFNASRTSHIDALVLLESEQEVLFVASYSEDEDNFSGNCRFVVLRQGTGGAADASFSFGSEFSFELRNQIPSPVFDKRACLLVDNRFALVYVKDNLSVNLLVGSVGTDVSDADGRLSNSDLVKSQLGSFQTTYPSTQGVYSACRVDETMSFVVFCVAEEVTCRLASIDADFALYLTREVQIDRTRCVRLSCDCMNKRILVSSVDVDGAMKVHVLTVVEGPDLMLLASAAYSLASADASLNASSEDSFVVDPNATVKWASDVFRVVTLQVRRQDANVVISRPEGGTSAPFPLVALEKNEYHRVRVVAHPLDPDVPVATLESVKVFTSQTQNIEYASVQKDSMSMLLYVSGSINTLFYGVEGETNRGVINLVDVSPDHTIPFSVFVSGVHDVGNKPFTFRAAQPHLRSCRAGFASPGPNASAAGAMVSVDGTGFLFAETSELWSFRDESWSLLSPGGPGSAERPGPRRSAMLTNDGKRVYLLGGVSTARSTAPTFETPNYALLPSAGGYLLKNLKSDVSKISFYDVVSETGRTSFASLSDPGATPLSGTGWEGLVDVSSFFERTTFGILVNSFAPATATYTHDVSTSAGVWGQGPNPTGHRYSFEVELYPYFESVDLSGTLDFAEDARVRVEVFDGSDRKHAEDFTIGTGAWSNVLVHLDTSSWTSADLGGMVVALTCSNLFMRQGFCAVRDPELFVTDYDLPLGEVSVEVYTTVVKQDARVSSFQLAAYTFDTEDILKDDLWSIVVEPFFSSLVFSLLLSVRAGVVDRCNKTRPELVSGNISLISSNVYLSTMAVAVTEGPDFFSDAPSMMFNGSSAFTLPSSGTRLRGNGTGDFTFSCTIEPRVCKSLLSIDHSQSNLLVSGEQPSSYASIGTSNSVPHVYETGRSLVFDNRSAIDFEMLLPGQFMVNAFVLLPSTASGTIPVLRIGGLQLVATDDDILQVDAMGVPFPRNQWFHVSWIGNGMAMRLAVDGEAVSLLVARDTVASFRVGGTGWNGNMLVAGVNVCTTFNNRGIEYLVLLSDDHRGGHRPGNSYTLMSCGVNNNDLRLSIDTSGTVPLLVASLLNQSTQQVLPDGIVDVCMGREAGVLRLIVGLTESSVPATVSTSLLSGDLIVGGRRGFYSFTLATYCGAADEIKLLVGLFRRDSNVHVLDDTGLRVRSMRWQAVDYVSHADNTSALSPRAGGSLTMDSATPPNLWLFGGEGVNGSANDLWQITTGAVSVAYNVLGSSLSTGITTASTPGSRSHTAHYNDGEYLYVLGGETGPRVGPFEFNGALVRLYSQTGDGTPSTPFWQSAASVQGALYPVFTKNTAVLADHDAVVWAEVSDGLHTFFVFLFPERDQEELGANAFLRSSPSSLPALLYDDHVNTKAKSALSDFWRYSINTASWELLNQGSLLRSATTPGVRSRANLHYNAEDRTFYLLPGQSSLPNVFEGQDLWAISGTSGWEWKPIRLYSQGGGAVARHEFSDDGRPGSAPSLYWPDDTGRPRLWAASGHVFNNQLTGASPETNLHYCIAINSEFKSDLNEGASIRFLNRTTLDASTVFPGVLDVQPLSATGDGCFLVATSKFIFAELSLSDTSVASYDPTQLVNGALEVVRTLPSQTSTLTLVRGVKYAFRSVDAGQVSAQTVPEVEGVSLVAADDFTITIGSVQLSFVVLPFDAHDAVINYVAPPAITSLQALHAARIADTIDSSAFSDYRVSVATSAPSGAKFRLAYQNQLNNRHGEVATVDFDRTSGNFSLLGNLVFSSSNPTTDIATANARFGRTVITFATADGTSSLLCDDAAVGPATLQSAVDTSSISVAVLNTFEIDAADAKWMVFFLYNGNLRVCAQKSVSNQLNAPVQNLVGATIRYSDSYVLDTVAAERVRLCRLESGELQGEVVTVYSTTAGQLFYKDALVSVCDPLNTSTPPAPATETFSLIAQVNLISTDVSDFEVVSLEALGSTNFAAVFLSADRLRLSYRVYAREAGAYLSDSERPPVVTFDQAARLVKAERANVPDAYHLHLIVGEQVVVLYTRWDVDTVDPVRSAMTLFARLQQSIDNADPISKASSVLTAERVIAFSVHENATTQVCPITSRVLSHSTSDLLLLASTSDRVVEQGSARRSFKTRVRTGDYSLVSTFVDEIRTMLATIDANFDCVYDEATTKISIRNEFSRFVILLSNSIFPIQDESASNGLGYILGFRDFTDIVSAFDGSIYRADSTNRIDLFGRHYLYLFLSTPDGPISSETTSRNKENAFGRIILSVDKGETMFFTSNLYEIFANVSIPVVTQLRVKLVRFSQINTSIEDSRDLYLYEPQGMEHSFSLRVHSALDKVGSGRSDVRMTRLPVFDDPSRDVPSEDDDSEDSVYFG